VATPDIAKQAGAKYDEMWGPGATVGDMEGAPSPAAAAATNYDKTWGDGATVGDVTASKPTDNTAASTTGEPAKGGRDWNDFLLNMGLGLMAGKSPYAFQNLGEAGIGALRQEQEAKKQALEERKVAGLESLQKQQGQYYGSEAEKNKAIAGFYNDQKGPQAALAQADAMFKTYMSGAGRFATAAQQETQRRQYMQDAYNALGVPLPSSMMASSGKGNDPLGMRS
jgi:hypothetical protein